MNDAPVLAGVQTVADIDAADDFQRKHVPYVAVERDGGECRITVEVGHYFPHPNQPDHWIETIEIAAAGSPIATYYMAAGVVEPKVTCTAALDPGTPILVTERCNLHGVWAANASA